ncbi:zinc finger protein draculin-like [Papilio machaon]|uniref:zinc finger protein draculin-like n=1 Tax=Papilio machaon TaxID=76193 RepID=UPI001E662A5A|nr:zinc finger protein draculin-like [Papilio machaon]
MDVETETYYLCMLCVQLECKGNLIQLQADEEVLHKTMAKLSRLNIWYDYGEIFPKYVCQSCNDNVDKAFEFVSKIEKAHKTLFDLYTNKNNCIIEQDSDISENEKDIILISENEDHDINEDQQCYVLENNQFSDDQQNHVLDLQQNGCLEHQQEDISEYQQIEILEHQQSAIAEHMDPIRDKSDCGSAVDFEMNPQSSDNNSIISENSSWLNISCNTNNSESTYTRLTWNDYLWSCSICETQFSTIEELKLHSMQFHHICNALKCHHCNITILSLNELIVHVQSHNEHLKFMCYKCNCNFSNTPELNNHIEIEHGSKTQYVCPGCNTDYENSEKLQVHMDTYYRGKQSKHVPKELVSNQNSLSCEICKKSFKNKQLLNNHLSIHTKEHMCDKCGEGFFSKKQLKSHSISHEEKLSHECSVCKSSFKTLQHLKNHIAVHSSEKPHKCDQCGKEFRLKKQLNSHIIIHNNSLQYDCMYCDKKFRLKTIRDQHIRQHTEFKPNTTEICARGSKYNKHMKRRHDLNMAKKKRTPEGVYPNNPSTGKIIKCKGKEKETLEPKNRNGKGKAKRMSYSTKQK